MWKWLLKPLWNERGAIPSSLSDDYGALLTTTARAMQPVMHDNITRGNKFLAWTRQFGVWRDQDGGERVKVALMHAQNTTADWYSGYGTLDTTPQDGITSSFYDWAQLSCSTAISRKEERQNSGRSRLLNLLESKLRQTEVTMQEKLNLAIVEGRITASASLGRFLAIQGNLDSGAAAVLPIPALIDSNASRSVSIGNINGNTHSFWRNQAQSSTATTFAGMKQEMNNHYNDCSKGAGGNPNLMLGDQVAWEQYWNSLQNQERYVVTDQRVIDVLGGSDMLKFRGATFVWDEMVPDTETNATVVGGIGTVSVSTIFFINSQTVEWVVDASTDFIMTPYVRPENQDARVSQNLWMGALGLNNRRKNGVLYGISQSITS